MLSNVQSRLRSLLAQSKFSHEFEGMLWYHNANFIAAGLSEKYKVDLFRVIGVMAALSPNNKWERNIKDTELFLAAPSLETKVCTFMGQRVKALKILQAKNELEVNQILGGRKTISFFTNIMYPDTSELVTVDLWMYRIADLKQSKKNYEIISEAVTSVSKEYKILPHQLQAIVWGVVRPNKGSV